MDQRRLTELRIQAGNAEELVLLTPGVVNNAASQFSTDGGAQFSNEYAIDGVVEPEFIVRKSTARAPHKSSGRMNH